MANTPNAYVSSDNSSVSVGGLIENTGSKTYSNVLLKIGIIDRDGNVLNSK